MKNKHNKKRKIRIIEIVPIVISVLALLLVLCCALPQVIEKYPLEKAAKKLELKEDEDFCRVELINNKTAIAFFKYDCKSMRVLKGIKKCKGEYYIFINKIIDKWIVNESSKKIMW